MVASTGVNGLQALWVASATEVYAAGEAVILHSSDGGKSWSRYDVGPEVFNPPGAAERRGVLGGLF